MTPTRTFELLLPFAPDTINQVLFEGSGVIRLKNKWQQIAETYLAQAIAEGELPERFLFTIKLTFHMYFSLKRIRDQDNFAPMSKGITDAFTSMAMVADDSDEYVAFGGIFFHVEPERPRVVVIIEEFVPFAIHDNGLTIQPYAAQ